MTDQATPPTTPWPVDHGDLAMGVVAQLIVRLSEKQLLSVGDIKDIFNETARVSGPPATQEAVRAVLNTLYPGEVKI